MDTKTRTLANMSDLDAWIEKAEDMGQLKRITAEVDPNLETSTITYMVGREPGSAALLFENIKGHPGHKAIYNLIGCNLDRFCLSIGEAPVDHCTQLAVARFGFVDQAEPGIDGRANAFRRSENLLMLGHVGDVLEAGDDPELVAFGPEDRPMILQPMQARQHFLIPIGGGQIGDINFHVS